MIVIDVDPTMLSNIYRKSAPAVSQPIILSHAHIQPSDVELSI